MNLELRHELRSNVNCGGPDQQKSIRTFCASFGGSIFDLTIFNAIIWPVFFEPSKSSAWWQIAKPPLPSCCPVSYRNRSGSLTTAGGASAWLDIDSLSTIVVLMGFREAWLPRLCCLPYAAAPFPWQRSRGNPGPSPQRPSRPPSPPDNENKK